MRMISTALVLVLSTGVLAQDSGRKQYSLEYKQERWRGEDVDVDYKLTLNLDGNDTTVDFFRSASPFFAFEEIHIKGEANRRPMRNGKIRMRYVEATVDGRYDDEDYEFNFEQGVVPDDLDENKLKQFVYFLFAAGKTMEIEKDGTPDFQDKNQDSTGEYLDIVGQGVIRMPSIPVTVGAEWEKVYRTRNVDKKENTRIEITQKSKLDRVEDGRAYITSTLKGEVVSADGEEIKKDNPDEEKSTDIQAEIKTVFHLKDGRLINTKSSGKLAFSYKAPDPNGGDDHELELTLTIDSRIEPQ